MRIWVLLVVGCMSTSGADRVSIDDHNTNPNVPWTSPADAPCDPHGSSLNTECCQAWVAPTGDCQVDTPSVGEGEYLIDGCYGGCICDMMVIELTTGQIDTWSRCCESGCWVVEVENP